MLPLDKQGVVDPELKVIFPIFGSYDSHVLTDRAFNERCTEPQTCAS